MTPHRKNKKLVKKWSPILVGGLIVLSIGVAARAVLKVEHVGLEQIWSVADQELDNMLQFGEKRIATAKVYRRKASDYFRRTPGLLSVTSRRIIFVGVGSKDKLAGPDAPIPIDSREYRNDTSTITSRSRMDMLTVPGIRLKDSSSDDKFGAYSGDREELDTIVYVIQRAQARQRFLATRDSTLRAGVASLSRRPLYYIVKRGDALINIANRFGTIPDSLKSWNQLSSDKVRIRDSLIVKPKS